MPAKAATRAISRSLSPPAFCRFASAKRPRRPPSCSTPDKRYRAVARLVSAPTRVTSKASWSLGDCSGAAIGQGRNRGGVCRLRRVHRADSTDVLGAQAPGPKTLRTGSEGRNCRAPGRGPFVSIRLDLVELGGAPELTFDVPLFEGNLHSGPGRGHRAISGERRSPRVAEAYRRRAVRWRNGRPGTTGKTGRGRRGRCSVLLPADAGLPDWPSVRLVLADDARRFCNGNPAPVGKEATGRVRVVDENGRLLGLAECSGDRPGPGPSA